MPDQDRQDAGARSERGIGPCTRLVVAVTMAGALVGGGGVMALLSVLRPASTHLLLGMLPFLFAAGAAAGFFHAAVLAWLSRPRPCGHGGFRAQLVRGAAWSVPGLAVAGLIAFWTAYTASLAGAGNPWWLAAVIGGWLLGAAVCAWASVEAWSAVRLAVTRWPERRAGLALLLLTFAGLVLLLAGMQIRVRGLEVGLSPLSAAPFAFALTLWIAAPVAVLVLHSIRRRWPAGGHGA